MKTVIAEIKQDQIRKLASHDKREDGRRLIEMREIKFERNPIGTAEGSARLWLGKTEVIIGVKLSIDRPYPDHPNEGVLRTGVEMKPMAHPDFNVGAPKPGSVEFARVIDRGIRESRMIDLEKLCIEPHEKVWVVNLDIQAIDYDGNMIDAGTIGSNIALQGTTVPASKFGLGEDYPLPVKDSPVSVTFVKIGEHVMVDPTDVEEGVAEARLTVASDSNGDIRAMQKGLSGAFRYEQISSIVDKSVELGKLIRQKISQN